MHTRAHTHDQKHRETHKNTKNAHSGSGNREWCCFKVQTRTDAVLIGRNVFSVSMRGTELNVMFAHSFEGVLPSPIDASPTESNGIDFNVEQFMSVLENFGRLRDSDDSDDDSDDHPLKALNELKFDLPNLDLFANQNESKDSMSSR